MYIIATPTNLRSSINSNIGIVKLNWSSPTFSLANYNCSNGQCWKYEVQLINTNDQSQVITMEPEDNQLEINIATDKNSAEMSISSCQNYKWTVTVLVISSETRSTAVEGPTIELLSGETTLD